MQGLGTLTLRRPNALSVGFGRIFNSKVGLIFPFFRSFCLKPLSFFTDVHYFEGLQVHFLLPGSSTSNKSELKSTNIRRENLFAVWDGLM